MDAGNDRIQRFAPGSAIGVTVAAMAFSTPKGMRLDSVGNIFIADQGNHRIVVFKCSKSIIK